MIEIDDTEFERMVADAIDGIPEHYAKRLNNLGFVIEDEPTPEQRSRLHLHNGMTLFGLYEGVPLTRRGAGYSGVLPDKITIFKQPMLASVHSVDSLRERIKNTVWHEVAHYFGLDHSRIDELEGRA